jgi:hypothetical protein
VATSGFVWLSPLSGECFVPLNRKKPPFTTVIVSSHDSLYLSIVMVEIVGWLEGGS